MSWSYSQALAAEYLADCFADTGLYARLNSIRTVDLFLYNDRTTDDSRLSRFGMTYEHLTDDYGEAVLTWYREAFRATTSVPPETAPELPANNPRSGSKCSASFGRYDRSTSSWKTPLNLFGEDSTLSSAAWTKAGTMRNGVCWERTMSVRRTSENAAGFWHTPTVVQFSRSEEAWMKRRQTREAAGRTSLPPGSLEEQVLMSGKTPCWDWNCSPVNPRNKKTSIPTPRAQDALNRTNPCQYRRPGVPLAAWVCMYPTATASGLCGGTGSFQKLKELMGKGVITPRERRGMAQGNGGKLNPEWVELLMNFPVGWTEIKRPAAGTIPEHCKTPGAETGNGESHESSIIANIGLNVSKDSATPKSPSAPPSHGNCCMNESTEEKRHEH